MSGVTVSWGAAAAQVSESQVSLWHFMNRLFLCEPSCEYWEPDPGPPKEQHVLLTTQSSLQSHKHALNLARH